MNIYFVVTLLPFIYIDTKLTQKYFSNVLKNF